MKRELLQQAREMRQAGKTVIEIARTLQLSKGTVSIWVRDIILTPAQVEAIKQHQHRYGAANKGSQANRARYLELRKSYQEQGRAMARQGRPLHMAGCMLYWAEGAKARNDCYFVNSDPNMLRFFLRFVREEMGILDHECSLKIHCHFPDRERQQIIEQYWLDTLGLPASCLRKTMYKKGQEGRKNTLINGVCGIRIHKTAILQHIYGAIQEYAGFDNPDWLF